MRTIKPLRRYENTAANWAADDPILPPNWEGVESDTGRDKCGDGLTRWNSLAYGRPIPSDLSMALKFTAANAGHVNHGLFWVPDVEYGNFYADALIKPTNGDGSGQYFISAGYGGNHCLLLGVQGTPAAGYVITGNVYDADTATITSFLTTEKIRDNEWAYIAAFYNGSKLGIAINGVPSSLTTYAAARETDNGFEGVLFVGGSDHNMFDGRIGGIRIFEGVELPYDNAHIQAIRPPIAAFGDVSVLKSTATVVNASFAADYRTGSLADISAGLSGAKHNGRLASASTITAVAGNMGDPAGYDRSPLLRPAWVVDPFEYSTTAPAAQTPIAGARIYDDFSRADVHFGKSETLGLGNTTVGSAAWSGAHFGILNGNAFYDGQAGTVNAIITDAGNTDGTIIWRRPDTTMPTGIFAAYRMVFRQVDASNYCELYIDENNDCQVRQITAGVPANLGALIALGAWTEVKVVLLGTSLNVHAGGASLASRTLTVNLTGTGKGFGAVQGAALRISEFAII